MEIVAARGRLLLTALLLAWPAETAAWGWLAMREKADVLAGGRA